MWSSSGIVTTFALFLMLRPPLAKDCRITIILSTTHLEDWKHYNNDGYFCNPINRWLKIWASNMIFTLNSKESLLSTSCFAVFPNDIAVLSGNWFILQNTFFSSYFLPFPISPISPASASWPPSPTPTCSVYWSRSSSTPLHNPISNFGIGQICLAGLDFLTFLHQAESGWCPRILPDATSTLSFATEWHSGWEGWVIYNK